MCSYWLGYLALGLLAGNVAGPRVPEPCVFRKSGSSHRFLALEQALEVSGELPVQTKDMSRSPQQDSFLKGNLFGVAKTCGSLFPPSG